MIGQRFGYPAGNDLPSLTLPKIDLADDTVCLVFAFLCRDDNASCAAFDTALRSDIFDIAPIGADAGTRTADEASLHVSGATDAGLSL